MRNTGFDLRAGSQRAATDERRTTTEACSHYLALVTMTRANHPDEGVLIARLATPLAAERER